MKSPCSVVVHHVYAGNIHWAAYKLSVGLSEDYISYRRIALRISFSLTSIGDGFCTKTNDDQRMIYIEDLTRK